MVVIHPEPSTPTHLGQGNTQAPRAGHYTRLGFTGKIVQESEGSEGTSQKQEFGKGQGLPEIWSLRQGRAKDRISWGRVGAANWIRQSGTNPPIRQYS